MLIHSEIPAISFQPVALKFRCALNAEREHFSALKDADSSGFTVATRKTNDFRVREVFALPTDAAKRLPLFFHLLFKIHSNILLIEWKYGVCRCLQYFRLQ